MIWIDVWFPLRITSFCITSWQARTFLTETDFNLVCQTSTLNTFQITTPLNERSKHANFVSTFCIPYTEDTWGHSKSESLRSLIVLGLVLLYFTQFYSIFYSDLMNYIQFHCILHRFTEWHSDLLSFTFFIEFYSGSVNF